MPFNVRDGINVFLAGFIPTENLRFREMELSFKVAQTAEDAQKRGKRDGHFTYEAMTKTLQGKGHTFKLHVEAGNFSESEIIVMLGENGTGKTTFIRMLAGLMKCDEEEAGRESTIPALSVSYKPQTISPKFVGSVESLFQMKIRTSYMHPQFQTDVLKPMCIDGIMEQPVNVLSGGELQRVAIVLALGKPANIYLIDEPSAYLDSEQRIVCARVGDAGEARRRSSSVSSCTRSARRSWWSTTSLWRRIWRTVWWCTRESLVWSALRASPRFCLRE